MTKLKDDILKLRQNGKSYRDIAKILDCSKGTVCYHCCDGQHEKSLARSRKRRSKLHPLTRKIENFCATRHKKEIKIPVHKTKKLLQLKIYLFARARSGQNKGVFVVPEFTVEDVLKKVGQNPKCYLTGKSIDINQPRTYQLDHILPVSRGGSNSLDNLQIASKEANQCKGGLTNEEFINLCKAVLEYHGYNII